MLGVPWPESQHSKSIGCLGGAGLSVDLRRAREVAAAENKGQRDREPKAGAVDCEVRIASILRARVCVTVGAQVCTPSSFRS